MYPEIHNTDGDTLAVLNNITSNKLIERINGKFIFNFTAAEEKYKSDQIQFNKLVYAGNNYFDIIYIDVDHDYTGKVEYDVKCEHVFYRLLEEELDNYAYTGTPSEILTDLLAGTDFTVGPLDFTSEVAFAVNRNTNKMQIIIALANTLGGELSFTNDGFSIGILNTVGQDNGYRVEINKNLSTIRKIIDKRNDTTTYKFDVVDIFNSEEYEDFKGLETIGKGDVVQVKDSVINIDVTQSVYEISRDIIKSKNLKVITGNNFDNITDDNAFLQKTAIKQDDIIYGVKINNDVGIEIERNDKLARTKLNADEFKMQTGDGSGSYTDALYFDPIDEKYIFVGELNASDIVGGTISIGDNFTVDSFGNMTATNADFSGNISSSAITGGTITGATATFGSSGKVELYSFGGEGRIEFLDDEENKLASITPNSTSNRIDFDMEFDKNFRMGTSGSGNITISSSNDLFLEGFSDIRFNIRPDVNGTNLALVSDIETYFAGHGIDIDSNNTIDVDETELDFSGESRSWFEGSSITRPYFSSNYCYVDTDGTNVVFRDSKGDAVATITDGAFV